MHRLRRFPHAKPAGSSCSSHGVGIVASSQAFAADSTTSFRLTVKLNGVGVKDNSTGLIWEQEPDREHAVQGASAARCATKEVGGQKEWCVPYRRENLFW